MPMPTHTATITRQDAGQVRQGHTIPAQRAYIFKVCWVLASKVGHSRNLLPQYGPQHHGWWRSAVPDGLHVSTTTTTKHKSRQLKIIKRTIKGHFERVV